MLYYRLNVIIRLNVDKITARACDDNNNLRLERLVSQMTPGNNNLDTITNISRFSVHFWRKDHDDHDCDHGDKSRDISTFGRPKAIIRVISIFRLN